MSERPRGKRKLPFLVKAGIAALAVIAALMVLAVVRQNLATKADASLEAEIQGGDSYAPMVADDHPALVEFNKRHPDRNVMLACAYDIDDNGCEDLVTISRKGDACQTIVMLGQKGGSYTETEPIPGPYENQRIKFFDMDHFDPIEVMITGEKNSQVGYAAYQMRHGELYDLFAQNMEDCC